MGDSGRPAAMSVALYSPIGWRQEGHACKGSVLSEADQETSETEDRKSPLNEF